MALPMKFSEWLMSEAKSDRIIVYHGTTPALFKTIMSQGLIPSPKKRSWDDDQHTSYFSPSRVSIDGIYVTTNLMTAISSSTNRHDRELGKLIVVCEIQPKTGFMDEDDFNFLTQTAQNDYMASALYGAILKEPQGDFVKGEFKKYKDNMNLFLYDKSRKPVHPELVKRVEPLLWNTFVAATERLASYADSWSYRQSGEFGDIKQPDKQKAEKDFLDAKEALTRTLKQFASPHNYDPDKMPFNFSSRIMEPIKFSGPNRIVCIVHEPKDYKEPPEVWYGTPPEQFIKDWKSRVGEWNGIKKGEK